MKPKTSLGKDAECIPQSPLIPEQTEYYRALKFLLISTCGNTEWKKFTGTFSHLPKPQIIICFDKGPLRYWSKARLKNKTNGRSFKRYMMKEQTSSTTVSTHPTVMLKATSPLKISLSWLRWEPLQSFHSNTAEIIKRFSFRDWHHRGPNDESGIFPQLIQPLSVATTKLFKDGKN